VNTAPSWTDPEGVTLTCTATLNGGAALPSTLISFNSATKTYGPGSTTPIIASQANQTLNII
jgi:hypothetical protein